MKRLWIGVGFLLVMLVIGILLTLEFDNIHQPLAQGLDRAAALSEKGQWEEAETVIISSREDWMKSRHFVAAVADHEPLEELESYLDQLVTYAKMRNSSEFAALCVRVAGMARAMGESQQVTWWNLL